MRIQNGLLKQITIDDEIICLYIVETKGLQVIVLIHLMDKFRGMNLYNFVTELIYYKCTLDGYHLGMYQLSTYPFELYKEQQKTQTP
jgi:hypothetical protein